MQSITNIKSISYVKSDASQVSEDLGLKGNLPVTAQNDGAGSAIESVGQFHEKEALLAALKIIVLGEQDRLQNKGFSAEKSRAQLRAARQADH